MNRPSYDELLAEIEELKKQLADKKSLEKELRKAKILMQAAFDQSPVPLMVVTYPDFTFRIINKATEDFLLADASNYLNKIPTEIDWTWKEYYPDGNPVSSLHELPLPMAMQGITTINKEMYIVRHDGSIVWELVSASPIYDDEGSIIGGICAITDITERKKTEQILEEKEKKLKEKNEEFEAINEELRESNENLYIAKNKAEESDKLKTAFLQNMSHEIRTPMNAIMGFSDLLTENFENKDKLEKFTEIIKLRCDDLLVIINDILDFSKIESGLLTIIPEKCDIKSLFNELNAFFTEPQKRTDNIRLNFETYDNNSNFSFITDKVKLKQILINLIGNALKFTEQGSVTCGCKADNNLLVFHVIDTGIGIPLDKQEYIFERFSQLNQLPQKNLGGTGLGLSIVKGLTNLLGGKVWLESEAGKGSTFYFSIKYEKSDILTVENPTNEENYSVNNSNKTILIVEDDYYNSEFLKEVFSSFGFHIITTQYGQEAIHIALNNSIDLILMDIRLPDITGYDASKAILQMKPNMKIIAQTAYAALDERANALNNGCVDYISKPTKRDLLLLLIIKYLTN
jgi:signal transduction histidine kinase